MQALRKGEVHCTSAGHYDANHCVLVWNGSTVALTKAVIFKWFWATHGFQSGLG